MLKDLSKMSCWWEGELMGLDCAVGCQVLRQDDVSITAYLERQS